MDEMLTRVKKRKYVACVHVDCTKLRGQAATKAKKYAAVSVIYGLMWTWPYGPF